MKWAKRGLIYCPDGKIAWAKQYAFPPTPVLLSSGELRLYVAFCNEHTVGRIGYVDVDPNNPSHVIRVSERPVLDIGEPGCFDENGILPTSIVPVNDALYLYYVGYQLGYKVRYFQFQGAAISTDGGASFSRLRKVPVIDRSDEELLNRTSAFVTHTGGGFQMWYVGGSEWLEVGGKTLPRYNLRYLESVDGLHWGPVGKVCLDFRSDDEHAFGRPWIYQDGDLRRMFFSVRTKSKGYRLGYAESRGQAPWIRKDEDLGLDVSASGWDSEMIAYASVVRCGGRVHLFYNGNNCGQTGFGYATLEQW